MQVTQSMVSGLMKKVRKNPDFFEEMLQKQNEKAAQKNRIIRLIQELNDEQEIIKSIPTLAKHIKSEHGLEIKPWVLAKIMKEDMGM